MSMRHGAIAIRIMGNNGMAQIKPGEIRNPNGRGHSKNKTAFDELQKGIAELVKMVLAVLPTPEDKKVFQQRLNESAKNSPFLFVVKVVIPMLKALPPPTVIEVFASITNATEDGDVVEELRAIRQVLSEALEKGIDLDSTVDSFESCTKGTRCN